MSRRPPTKSEANYGSRPKRPMEPQWSNSTPSANEQPPSNQHPQNNINQSLNKGPFSQNQAKSNAPFSQNNYPQNQQPQKQETPKEKEPEMKAAEKIENSHKTNQKHSKYS